MILIRVPAWSDESQKPVVPAGAFDKVFAVVDESNCSPSELKFLCAPVSVDHSVRWSKTDERVLRSQLTKILTSWPQLQASLARRPRIKILRTHAVESMPKDLEFSGATTSRAFRWTLVITDEFFRAIPLDRQATLIHELGHFIDFDNRLSNCADWIAIEEPKLAKVRRIVSNRPVTGARAKQQTGKSLHQMAVRCGLPSYYASINLDESIAESFLYVLLAPKEVQTKERAFVRKMMLSGTKPDRASELALQAELLMDRGEYATALPVFSQAIVLDPHVSNWYCYRSECYRQMKQYDLALNDANMAIFEIAKLALPQYEYRFRISLMQRAEVLEDMGDRQGAGRDWEPLVHHFPHNRYFRSQLAWNALALGLSKSALPLYSELARTEKSPSSKSYYLRQLGACQRGLEKYTLALKDFDRALSLDPRNTLALYDKAGILSWLGSHASSLCTLRHVELLDPKFEDLQEKIRLEESFCATLKEAQVFGPQDARLAKTLKGLADLYKTQGNYVAAEPLYKRVLRINESALGANHPNVGVCLMSYAEVLRQMHRTVEAGKLATRARAILNAQKQAITVVGAREKRRSGYSCDQH